MDPDPPVVVVEPPAPVRAALPLAGWKLTTPLGPSEHPTEVTEAALLTGYQDQWFHRDLDGKACVFGCPVTGVTTSGSDNPRCELREMKPIPGTPTMASWSTTSGRHTLRQVMAFTRLPTGKPGVAVVGGQIHDAADDVVVWRCETSGLWLAIGDHRADWKLIDPDYQLGAVVQTGFVVENGVIAAEYNGKLVAAVPARATNCYFKAGAYVQISAGASPMADSNYGETVYHELEVTHTDTPVPPVVVPPTPSSRPKRVVIVCRHAEKDDDSDGKDDILHELSATGLQRAEALKTMFLKADLPAGLYHPDRCVASKGNTASDRPLKTIEPYQLDAGLPMNAKYDAEKDHKVLGPWLAQRLDVTMACLEHSAIVDTCKGLGKISPALPKAWDSKRFDLFWVFGSDDGKSWTFTQVPQMLLPGDKSTPIK